MAPCPPPFAPPLPAPPRCGWRGGLRCAPTWYQSPSLDFIATSGLHALLRASGLPREELLHMGAPHWLLSSSAPGLTRSEAAAKLLGRIVWDRIFGEAGQAFGDQHALIRLLGRGVIAEWFA